MGKTITICDDCKMAITYTIVEDEEGNTADAENGHDSECSFVRSGE